ncbi:uncharacterized protein [Emydura macquarii macquarii]|uniref:uncharacterized protein n=1 Tax=Emydura macquarii macquarii TaxID=1129001 RepID=UPI00352A10F0
MVVLGPSGLSDDIPACRNFSMAVPAGDSGNISIPVPHSILTPSFFVQKYNTTTSSWEDVILSSDEGSEKLLSSFKETLSFSGGYFKIENASKGAEGCYRILDDMYKNCLAVVNMTVQVPESGSWILSVVPLPLLLLLLLGVVLVLLYKCVFMKSRGKVFAYPQQLLSKMTHFSRSAGRDQQSESSQDSQESEELTRLARDKDRDQALGIRERNGDPAPENGEGDLLTGDRDLTQEPREMDPLAEDTDLAQGTKDDGGGHIS